MDELETKRKLKFQKNFSIEKQAEFRRRSIIDQAAFDKALNREYSTTLQSDEPKAQFQVIFYSCSNDLKELAEIVQAFKNFPVKVLHVESRMSTSLPNNNTDNTASKNNENGDDKPGNLDLLFKLEAHESTVETLRKWSFPTNFAVIFKEKEITTPWYPTKVTDLDKCNHLLLKFQPELSSDHPGFKDADYRKRRFEISNLAFEFKQTNPIPRVEYTPEETQTWEVAYKTLTDMYPSMACQEHIDGLALLEGAGLFSPHFIPQLEDVSNFLRETSGFRLRPVAGLVSARDFLASLAFRVFQCTQYVRHKSKPLHTPEPDLIHELLGHMPMLTNRRFAEFSQQIGLASLGISDTDIEKLATLYWFTVEFGLIEDGSARTSHPNSDRNSDPNSDRDPRPKIRAMGAGLFSSYGELKHALSDVPKHAAFQPDTTAVTAYQDEDYQPIYFVAQSIEKMQQQLRNYSANFRRNFVAVYDPYTESIESVPKQFAGELRVHQNNDDVAGIVENIRAALDRLCAITITN